jgi:Asp/Glu/hydantoin racemase
MNLLVLNPNRSAAMTAQVLDEARRLAPAGLALRGLTAADGPPVIASREAYADGARAARALWPAQDDGWADALLLACFGDPGLAALRRASRVPVVGMAEAALDEAAARGRPFRIVTAGAAWEGMLREAVAAHPAAAALLDGIDVLDGTGLDIAQDPAAFAARVQGMLDAARRGGVPTCILGGCGFARIVAGLRHDGGLIDGIGAGVRAALRAGHPGRRRADPAKPDARGGPLP